MYWSNCAKAHLSTPQEGSQTQHEENGLFLGEKPVCWNPLPSGKSVARMWRRLTLKKRNARKITVLWSLEVHYRLIYEPRLFLSKAGNIIILKEPPGTLKVVDFQVLSSSKRNHAFCSTSTMETPKSCTLQKGEGWHKNEMFDHPPVVISESGHQREQPLLPTTSSTYQSCANNLQQFAVIMIEKVFLDISLKAIFCSNAVQKARLHLHVLLVTHDCPSNVK